MPQSLYVHVPFCEQICHYCDFNKFFLKNQPIEEYLELCEREILQTVEAFPPEKELSTIYIGGGTPTALTTTQLSYLLTAIKRHFSISEKVEWTVEVNPGSADEEKLSMMHELGVNRLSIGAQTFDPHLLKAINRDHEPSEVAKTVALSKKVGITNLSIDMMFGLPGQSFDQWQESLEEVCQLPITHISAYSLKIEEKTVFYQLMRKGKLSLPGEEIEANMYEYMLDMLDRNGFNHYEISNFAKSSYYSNHNLTYWNNNEYYGIGAGAHSYVKGVRRANHGPLPKYMKAIKEKKLPYFEENHVSLKEQMEEQMFMGLRKLTGVSFDTFKGRFGKDLYEVFPEAVTDLINRGLLMDTKTHLKLSKDGLLLGNEVFEQFLLTD
ncbi:oxygen-independent coproporphyrinogen III oxidase [Salipaludibacillus agaradhaerens]|uniref:radical SAM family heme chaperone HemW n=1 Tax=Salipaludibacillus agaradhaerens TaxID=76935 RepID=UPI002151FD23|nr:radical SAM family heme chaperone HemW [Salipaludibacillus agaradhaerens]MCR6106297.1 oxygen-independent coproporphyrinogen III oxidase [Salipaludibacillus agaradhaerens]MCR6118330.1 oxygen-independent coproporphyrinogen III oxidase [Salipaludibacillus agaradhaerens]